MYFFRNISLTNFQFQFYQKQTYWKKMAIGEKYLKYYNHNLNINEKPVLLFLTNLQYTNCTNIPDLNLMHISTNQNRCQHFYVSVIRTSG